MNSDALKIEVSKLHPIDGDLIVLKVPVKAFTEGSQETFESIRGLVGTGAKFLVISDGMSMDSLGPADSAKDARTTSLFLDVDQRIPDEQEVERLASTCRKASVLLKNYARLLGILERQEQ